MTFKLDYQYHEGFQPYLAIIDLYVDDEVLREILGKSHWHPRDHTLIFRIDDKHIPLFESHPEWLI